MYMPETYGRRYSATRSYFRLRRNFLQRDSRKSRDGHLTGLVARLSIRTGGFVGIYLGARLQKFVPQKFIKLLLGMMIVFLALKYILQFFIR